MLTYFLQVNVCWLLFYGAYYALLSRETFFKLNRIYLIISLLCGLIIPVVVPKMDAPMVQPLVEIVQPITVSVVQMQEFVALQTPETETVTWGIWTILVKFYSLGMAFFLLKFCWGLFTIFKLYRNGLKEKNKSFSLIYTEGVKTPFSFFNWIFLNQKTVENPDFQHIITHESAHVRQKHSFDILGLEILRGLFWLSPLVHLYARSLRNVHEYLADAAVLQNTQKQSYGRLLIRQTAAGSGLVLANHLNFSQLKKRITMMSRNPSQRLALAKYAFVAPIFLLIMVLLASPKTQILATTAKMSDKLVTTVEEKLNTGTPISVFENKVLSDLNLPTDSTRKPPFDVVKNPIPDPVVRFAGMARGTILREDFIKQTMLSLIQPLYSHTVFCDVQSFQVFRTPFGKDNYQVGSNTGRNFNENVLPIIQAAQNGDIYQFKNIKVRCPGDVVARSLGDLFFIIEAESVQKKLLDEKKAIENIGKTFEIKSECAMKEGDTGQMPVFQGGEAELEKFIYANLRYPEEAKKAGREALLLVNYIVNTDGQVSDVKSWDFKFTNPKGGTNWENRSKIEATDKPLVEEAIRVVSSMPRWKPGTRNGVVACHSKIILIKFQVEK